MPLGERQEHSLSGQTGRFRGASALDALWHGPGNAGWRECCLSVSPQFVKFWGALKVNTMVCGTSSGILWGKESTEKAMAQGFGGDGAALAAQSEKKTLRVKTIFMDGFRCNCKELAWYPIEARVSCKHVVRQGEWRKWRLPAWAPGRMDNTDCGFSQTWRGIRRRGWMRYQLSSQCSSFVIASGEGRQGGTIVVPRKLGTAHICARTWR